MTCQYHQNDLNERRARSDVCADKIHIDANSCFSIGSSNFASYLGTKAARLTFQTDARFPAAFPRHREKNPLYNNYNIAVPTLVKRSPLCVLIKKIPTHILSDQRYRFPYRDTWQTRLITKLHARVLLVSSSRRWHYGSSYVRGICATSAGDCNVKMLSFAVISLRSQNNENTGNTSRLSIRSSRFSHEQLLNRTKPFNLPRVRSSHVLFDTHWNHI